MTAIPALERIRADAAAKQREASEAQAARARGEVSEPAGVTFPASGPDRPEAIARWFRHRATEWDWVRGAEQHGLPTAGEAFLVLDAKLEAGLALMSPAEHRAGVEAMEG